MHSTPAMIYIQKAMKQNATLPGEVVPLLENHPNRDNGIETQYQVVLIAN